MPIASIIKEKDPEIAVEKAINLLGGISRFVNNGETVFIHPNWCGGVPNKQGSYTDPKVLTTLIKLIDSCNPSKIIVGESEATSQHFDLMYLSSGSKEAIEELKSTAGIDVQVVNLSEGEMVTIDLPDAYITKKLSVSKVLTEADKIINVPVFKSHVFCDITLSLKNMFGLLPERKKGRLHFRGLNEIIVDINTAFPSDLIVVDGIVGMEGWGPLKGDPIELGFILAGDNLLAVDTVGATIAGYDPASVTHFQLAAQKNLGPLSLIKIEIKGNSIDDVKPKSFEKAPESVVNGYREQVKELREQLAAKAISFEEGSDLIQGAIFDEWQDAFESWQSKSKPSAPKAVSKPSGGVKRSGKAEILTRMEKINRSEKAKEKMKKWAKKKPKIVQFILDGEPDPFYCVFEQDKVNVVEGTYEKNADVVFEADTETWTQIQLGEVDGVKAYYDGLYLIRGAGTKKFDDAKIYSDICWESYNDLNE
ncbi:MAG: DUF362 domain-containing protein [Candidatus Lokiarchaeota archaeon]|nr:DUF362 domain-containing protein [Candidatus Lokiarchaeota archaeon]